MSTQVKQVWTDAGEIEYSFTAGGTSYQVKEWSEVIEILNREEAPKTNAGYGQGRYQGD